MSQRALKKRGSNLLKQEKEIHQIYRKQPQALSAQKTKYTQRANANATNSKHIAYKINHIESASQSDNYVSWQKYSSTPNLATIQSEPQNEIVRSHSESDLSNIPEANNLMNAKSEFHLKSIASTDVPTLNLHTIDTSTLGDRRFEKNTSLNKHIAPNGQSNSSTVQKIRNSQCASSLNSSKFKSTATTSIVDTENIRVPIIGYEVMEERARFTVIIDDISIFIWFNF